MNGYLPVIGLEVHAQLKTERKLFCNCRVQYDAPSNTLICPVCTGLPGALPVLNPRAAEMAARVGLALNMEIEKKWEFVRKHYFYPDLPKGYQISMLQKPVARNGEFDFLIKQTPCRIRITEIHLEEDAGKLTHHHATGSKNYSAIDLNRCSVPLLEIVTAPDFHSVAETRAFAHSFMHFLQYIDVCEGVMAKGNIRFDVNVSVSQSGDQELRPRTEIKNLNSFRFLEQALNDEIERQIKRYESGDHIIRETRRFNAETGKTSSLRSKESVRDYRFFPEPDLPLYILDDSWLDSIRQRVPELPLLRIDRLKNTDGLSHNTASQIVNTPGLPDLFDACAAHVKSPDLLANWLTGEYAASLNRSQLDVASAPVSPQHLTDLIQAEESGRISHPAAKQAFRRMWETSDSADTVIRIMDLEIISNETVLIPLIESILCQFPDELCQYRSGKMQVFQFLMGRIMKAVSGRADPGTVRRLLKTVIEKQTM